MMLTTLQFMFFCFRVLLICSLFFFPNPHVTQLTLEGLYCRDHFFCHWHPCSALFFIATPKAHSNSSMSPKRSHNLSWSLLGAMKEFFLTVLLVKIYFTFLKGGQVNWPQTYPSAVTSYDSWILKPTEGMSYDPLLFPSVHQ